MNEEPIITSEGLKALEERLEYLETTRRREVSEQMKKAIEHGDLWENAEYDEARKEYLKLEEQINETAALIARAKVVVESDVPTDVVGVGSLVRIEDVEGDGSIKEYRVVGPTETDPDNGKISHLCPIGVALMGSKVGEVVSAEAPGGLKKYRILSISK